MRFQFIIDRTALITAVKKGNTEIAQLLLSSDKIDVNCPEIVIKNLTQFKKKFKIYMI